MVWILSLVNWPSIHGLEFLSGGHACEKWFFQSSEKLCLQSIWKMLVVRNIYIYAHIISKMNMEAIGIEETRVYNNVKNISSYVEKVLWEC